jgi:hypothetical protein
MMVYQEKIAPPGPLPVVYSEPADVLSLHRPVDSLKQENHWLKAQLALVRVAYHRQGVF